MNRLDEREALALLRSSGLLAEINRCVLHPRGLAMAVEVEDGGAVRFAGLLDYRAEDGIEFAPEDLQETANKLSASGLVQLHPPQDLPVPE